MKQITLLDLLRISKNNKIRDLHIILCNKNLDKLGEITNVTDIVPNFSLMSANELSFTVHKKNNGVKCVLWNKIRDFKVIYVKEYDEYFQIKVDKDESSVVSKKNITATSLSEAELSQVNVEAEINTETDIARPEYDAEHPTIFYNPDRPSSSLLDRLLEKAPGYTVKHVDDTLKSIQRTFSISGTNIYDFFSSTLSQEIGCLFLFNSAERGIYVYDLYTTCLDCGYRGEDSFEVCPECGSTIINKGYGKNTSVYIDKTCLGDGITLTSNAEAVKTCFKVTGGDDNINAAIKNVNPNGTNYIYYFNDDFTSDMPEELVEKLESYNALCAEYENTKVFALKDSLVSAYNDIITYINSMYPDSYNPLATSYTGYSNITKVNYDVIDMVSYITRGMMPTWESTDKTAESQLALLNTANISPVAVEDASNLSLYTANSSVLAMAKAIIDTGIYKVEIISSTLTSQTWHGRFRVENRSSAYEDDVAENTSDITVEINDYYVDFVNQQISRAIDRVNNPGLKDLFDIEDLDEFKTEIHKYALNSLYSFQSAYQTAINVLADKDISNSSNDLYEDVYLPYYNRFSALSAEISYRGSQIDTVNELADSLSSIIIKTNKELDFETYIGADLWKLFRAYVREDDYTNSNYISDGLDNAGVINKAKELMDTAKKALIKSGTKQFTISANLHNLLLITDEHGNRIFEPVVKDFALGNFIKCKIDDKVYSMRLSEISMDYNDLSHINCVFTDAYKTGTAVQNKVQELIKQVQSIGTTYNEYKKQAEQGKDANYTLEKMQSEGLSSAQYNVFSTRGTFIVDEHGALLQNYDDVKNMFSDEKCRLNGCDLIYTTNNWLSTDLALGKQKYTLDGVEYEEYGLNAKFAIASKIIAGDFYSADFTTDSSGKLIKGTHWDLLNNNADLFDGKIRYSSATNTLTMSGVTIDWNTSTTPSISNISGLSTSIANLETQIDGKIDTWNQSTDPSTSWSATDKTKHKGDIWYNGSVTKIWGGSSWTTTTDTTLKSLADSKKQVFTSTPVTPYYVGDLWVTSTDSNAELKVCKTARTSGSYTASDWVASLKYTDDTKANSAYTLADSAKGVADNAKEIGDKLVNVLGYDGTKITGTYIYSPVISGGSILIGDKTGTYAQITTAGVLYATGANISGKITATSGTIGGWKITSTDVYNNNGESSCGIGKDGVSPAFWAGSTFSNRGSALFSVSHGGSLYASDATIKGKITATSGTIGGWKISSNGMVSNIIYNSDTYKTEFKCPKLSSYVDYDEVLSIYKNGKKLFVVNSFGGLDLGNGNGYSSISLDGTSGTISCTAVFTSVTNDSDRDVKKDIVRLDKKKSSEFIYSLIPSEYRFRTGTSDRLHHGLIAQEVKDSMGENDWGLYVDKSISNKNWESIDDNGKKRLTAKLGLRYDELIADLIATVQSQNERIIHLEKSIQ